MTTAHRKKWGSGREISGRRTSIILSPLKRAAKKTRQSFSQNSKSPFSISKMMQSSVKDMLRERMKAGWRKIDCTIQQTHTIQLRSTSRHRLVIQAILPRYITCTKILVVPISLSCLFCCYYERQRPRYHLRSPCRRPP